MRSTALERERCCNVRHVSNAQVAPCPLAFPSLMSSSVWDLFGDDDAAALPRDAGPPGCASDALATSHPFFADAHAAAEAAAQGGEPYLRAALDDVERDAPDIVRRCVAALVACGEADGAALLSAGDAERFCTAALAALARGGWSSAPDWEEAHALRRVQLAAAALQGGDACTAQRHVDEAALASCRSRAEAYEGGPPALCAALAALTHAAAAAAPPPALPAALPPWALRVPSALPPGMPLCRPGATPAQAVPCVDYASLSVPAFVNGYLAPGRPVLLRGLSADWPATARWSDLGALRAGPEGARTLPVELPGRVVKHMPLRSLIDDHLAPAVARCWDGPGCTAAATTAYVSQHGALEQLPALAASVRVPRLACGALRAANLWLGTDGTVTALHTDDMQNVLAQVFGFKLVRLYLPPPGGAELLAHALRATPHPRAAPGAPLNLFCQADAEAEAGALRAAYPGLADMPPPMEALLGPGDALFIPRGAWHYVRALTPSCSVNFWW